MAVENIVIDPNGDMVLVLKNPDFTLFEPFRRPSTIFVGVWEMPPPRTDKAKDTAKDIVERYKMSRLRPTAVESDSYSDDGANSDDGADSHDGDNSNETEFHFLVSSRQLRIVSPYFDNIFKHGFVEANLKDDGKYYTEAEDFHPKALMHVLNIVHAQNQKVPQDISLEIVTHIAFIADYYDLKPALFFWLQFWKSTMPPSRTIYPYGQTQLMWLFVSREFDWQETLEDTQEAILRQCPDFTQHIGLPLDEELQKLFERRLEAMEKLMRTLAQLEDELQKGRLGCAAEDCHALFTAYIKNQRDRVQLLSKKQGVSFEQVLDSMTNPGPMFLVDTHCDGLNELRGLDRLVKRTPCCQAELPDRDYFPLMFDIMDLGRF